MTLSVPVQKYKCSTHQSCNLEVELCGGVRSLAVYKPINVKLAFTYCSHCSLFDLFFRSLSRERRRERSLSRDRNHKPSRSFSRSRRYCSVLFDCVKDTHDLSSFNCFSQENCRVNVFLSSFFCSRSRSNDRR